MTSEAAPGTAENYQAHVRCCARNPVSCAVGVNALLLNELLQPCNDLGLNQLIDWYAEPVPKGIEGRAPLAPDAPGSGRALGVDPIGLTLLLAGHVSHLRL